VFSTLVCPPEDPLHGVMARFQADPRPHRIDLGVGVYRDSKGRAGVMSAVKTAEQRLVDMEPSKAYLPLSGHREFVDRMRELVLGPLERDGRTLHVAAIQTCGGTGALRLAAALVARARPGARFHVGVPTWPSHEGVARDAGLTVATYPYLRGGEVDSERLLEHAASADAGDAFLMHGPCHNPTGCDAGAALRSEAIAALQARGAVPLIDAAYYGLADSLDQDLDVLRAAVGASERCMLAVSCSKAFGLYRERTGILLVTAPTANEARAVQGNLEQLSRALVSMAPSHGAAVVAAVLSDSALRREWLAELDGMRARLGALRQRLGGTRLPALARVASERGLFSMLPFSPAVVDRLAAEHAIYLPRSGRINVAGLRDMDVERFAAAVSAVLTS
jgi:aromatic-amino-acid transaminase